MMSPPSQPESKNLLFGMDRQQGVINTTKTPESTSGAFLLLLLLVFGPARVQFHRRIVAQTAYEHLGGH
jgi:hypothetical protein